MARKVYAIWHADGRDHLVPSRKHNCHCSIEAALRALEQQGRRCATDSFGFVKDASGRIITTIAL